ncbi:MAG TPA: hypothetical protein PKM36_08740 [Propionibacteriaceae bacterium]|nr:hypothetical protein [Propionibacteriaceae bacterium]HPZ48667.1 hypothetical protein [Propionibacteriaceae bacterium]
MAMRVAEAPTGGSRITYAVLATVLAGLGGALLGAVAWQVLTTETTCADDATELCGLALGIVFWTVSFWLVLAWLAFVFRLGWVFWLLIVVGQVVAAQAAVEWVSLWPVAALLLLVPLAAWLSTPGELLLRRGQVQGESTGIAPQRRWLLVGVCLGLVAQVVWWLVRLLG